MDAITIVAFIIGAVLALAFYVIKNKKLIKADKMASTVIGILSKVLDKYADNIKEYDKENGTDYFDTLNKTMDKIKAMEADTEITPIDFALDVIDMYEDIEAILKNTNLIDKVVTVTDKE